MKPADVAWPLRERNSLEISTRVEGTKHVQVGSDVERAKTAGAKVATPTCTSAVEGLPSGLHRGAARRAGRGRDRVPLPCPGSGSLRT